MSFVQVHTGDLPFCPLVGKVTQVQRDQHVRTSQCCARHVHRVLGVVERDDVRTEVGLGERIYLDLVQAWSPDFGQQREQVRVAGALGTVQLTEGQR